jgi:hypothetical protein
VVPVDLTASYVQVSESGRDFWMCNDFSATELDALATAAGVTDDISDGTFYINVHTQAYPQGEIRGQILSADNAAPAATTVQVNSSVVVTGDPGDRLVSATWPMAADPDGNTVNYIFQVSSNNTFTEVLATERFGSANSFSLTVAEAAMLYDELSGSTPGNVSIGASETIFVRVITTDGWMWTVGPVSPLTLTRGLVTDIESNEIPESFELRGNYPNPFNPSTNIAFDLPESSEVSIQVMDMLGRQVLSIPAQAMDAGTGRTIQVSADALPSGIYVYRVMAKSASMTQVSTGTMTLVK